MEWNVHSDITKRYFKLNIIYLDNIVHIISHFTRVCYGLLLKLSTLFDLTWKCKSVMKDILLQTKASQKTRYGTNDKKNRKKWHGCKNAVQILQDFSIKKKKKSVQNLSISRKLNW